jgi:predicted dehydrogenase
MSKKLGVAIVGCGFMGRRHMLGFNALYKAGKLNGEIVALLDINAETANNLADETFGLMGVKPRIYTSIDELLKDERVEALDIVTDPRTHHTIAIKAMEAGRHVLCEKPLALTMKTGRMMVAAAERTRMVLGTAENYRRGGANRVAKAVIDSGMLGKLHLMLEFWAGGDDKIIISKWRHMKDTGAIGLDMSIHYADIIEYYVGPVERVWGRGIIAEPTRVTADGSERITPTGEDALFASMETKDGIDVQYTYLPSGLGKRYQQRSVHGRNGSMTVPPDRSDGDVVVYLDNRELKGAELLAELQTRGVQININDVTAAVLGPDGTGGKGAAWADVDAGYLAVEIADFIEAVQRKRPPEVDGMGGLRALAVVYAILESGVAGREVSVAEILDGRLHTYQDEIDAAIESMNR